jgi:hypothetical protein
MQREMERIVAGKSEMPSEYGLIIQYLREENRKVKSNVVIIKLRGQSRGIFSELEIAS